MTHTLRHPLVLGLAAACLALTGPLAANGAPAPGMLEALFARYDREPDGPEKEKLAAEIDATAHQKYATVSRLYWHTDLASAMSAARLHGRPILHLRMLGRLDEDLSCANSRLFRATLYANEDVSALLRERFILYWSSERPVPRVTIDYGGGRRLEWTTTGNSAHYVLDEGGNVLDVLPGLYAPAAFRRELNGSLELAKRVRGASDDERANLLLDYHRQLVMSAARAAARIAATPSMRGAAQLLAERVESDLAAAQRRTIAKSSIEVRQLRSLTKGLAPEEVSPGQIATWAAVGRELYGLSQASSRVLDETSRTLIARLHNAVPRELRATDQQRDALLARLAQTIVADTAFNQLRLRPQIAREILRQGGRADFATLNEWIYAEVFRTPKQDAWLGLLPRDVFTALPGDGVVMR